MKKSKQEVTETVPFCETGGKKGIGIRVPDKRGY